MTDKLQTLMFFAALPVDFAQSSSGMCPTLGEATSGNIERRAGQSA